MLIQLPAPLMNSIMVPTNSLMECHVICHPHPPWYNAMLIYMSMNITSKCNQLSVKKSWLKTNQNKAV